MAPALRATVEPPPDIEVSEAKDEDLDSNKEVLGPLLEENSNGREAAEQERNEEDNRSIASSVLTASDKDRNDISNMEDNSDWLLTSGESSNKEDEEEDYDLPNRLQRQETPLNYTLSDDDRLSPNYSPISIRTRQIQSSGLSRFRQPPPSPKGFLTPSQEASMREAIEIMDREAEASAAVRSEPTADLHRTAERALQSIQQQEQLYPDDWIEDPDDLYYTPGGYFMDDLAVRIEALRLQLYREAGRAGVPLADL